MMARSPSNPTHDGIEAMSTSRIRGVLRFSQMMRVWQQNGLLRKMESEDDEKGTFFSMSLERLHLSSLRGGTCKSDDSQFVEKGKPGCTLHLKRYPYELQRSIHSHRQCRR